jgi:hypothetical protein
MAHTLEDFARSLERNRAALIAALEFYGLAANWREQKTGIGMFPSEADQDGGATARATLARVRTP